MRLDGFNVLLTDDTGIISTVVGDSLFIDVRGYATLGIDVTGNDTTALFDATIAIQGKVGDNWYNLEIVRSSDGAKVETFNPATAGNEALYIVAVAGLAGVRVDVQSAVTSGNLRIPGWLSVGDPGLATLADVDIAFSADSLSVDEIGAEAALADGVANPTIGALSMYGQVFNGTTWDRLIGDTVEGLRVHEATADTVILIADSMVAPVLIPKNLSFLMGLNDSGSFDQLRVDDAFRLRVSQDWNSTLQVFETTGDIDNDFAVVAGQEAHVMWIHVELITGTNVGARQVSVQIQDSADDVIAQYYAGVTQAASLTYAYTFAPGVPDLTAVRSTDNMVSTPIPGSLILPELFSVRVFDAALIDNGAPSSDDMQVQMMWMTRTRSDT